MRLGSPVAIGCRAAHLIRQGGDARVLAPLSASIYIVVRDQILWLGGPDDTLHPRAILLSEPPVGAACVAGHVLHVPPCVVPAWCPEPPPAGAQAAVTLQRGAARLAESAALLGRPQGFGAWLVGAPLAFPLAGAVGRVEALAAACADDAPARAADAAIALLGLGAGLTPSGDDVVGGAFFVRALLARAGACDVAAWRAASESIREAAMRFTHRVSATLLGDLLDGDGWAPLHALAGSLACGDESASREAARRLVRLGHSSGWDLLAGVVAGAAR